jgi:ABC-type transport system involved in cytochrome c biogenesis permease subunit
MYRIRIRSPLRTGLALCLSWCLAAAAALASTNSPSNQAAPVDWSAWRSLPVLHQGRVMPLDTFARQAVEIICGTANPLLDLAAEVSPADLSSDSLRDARKLFPGGARRFTAAELLLSWLLEPERWEDVPFLSAKNAELREKYLEVPARNAKGEHLKFVSPRQVMEASAMWARLDEVRERARTSQAGESFQPVGLDKKLVELQEAYQLYRELTFNAARVITFPEVQSWRINSRFLRQWLGVRETFDQIHPTISVFRAQDPSSPIAGAVGRLEQAVELLDAAAREAGPERTQLEPLVWQLVEAAEVIAGRMGELRQQLSRQLGGDEHASLSREKLQNLRSHLRMADVHARRLAVLAHELHMALYDNGSSLRLVPALNPNALDKDRQPQDDSQPWLSLPALLSGSPQLLKGYPKLQLQETRQAWDGLATAYRAWLARPSHASAADVAAASRSLARSLRALGEAIEPARRKLPILNRDEDLLAYTRYPPEGSTAHEVLYNRLNPFQKSWILSLLAALAFALAFGKLHRPLFWTGMVLALVTLAWTAYAFWLRVMITGWAPVTGMFETVAFVPWVVLLLACWFTLLPVTWPAIKAAWRLTAVPRTWEAAPWQERDQRIAGRWAAPVTSYLLLLPRGLLMGLLFYVLALAPYAAGGRTIINLLPNIDVGQRLPDLNDVVTWLVGLAVLIPSVWYLPRAVLALLVGALLVPSALRQEGRQRLAQVYPRQWFTMGGALVGTFLWMLACYAPVLDRGFSPLQPVLRDNFWLTIHVLTIVSSYGAGLLAWMLGNVSLAYYLFGRYRPPSAAMARHAETAAAEGEQDTPPAEDLAEPPVDGMRPPEACHTLAGYIYKAMQVAVLLLAAGTILGGLWADVSWGRFWGWDPKEVWALISCLVYLAILHGRYAGWIGDLGLAVGSVLGASAIIFSWYGVNFVLGVGLHSYGFGTGGQWWVGGFVLANWVLVALAVLRFQAQTKKTGLTLGQPGLREQRQGA